MPTVVIFSDNKFVEVDAPDDLKGEEMLYGTLYLSLLQKGLAVAKAAVVAEAAVYKRLYPGLSYGRVLEDDLLVIRE